MNLQEVEKKIKIDGGLKYCKEDDFNGVEVEFDEKYLCLDVSSGNKKVQFTRIDSTDLILT